MFDAQLALEHLSELVQRLGPRTSGTDAERAAANYLAETFRALGYEAEVQEFDFRYDQRLAQINIGEEYAAFALRFPSSAHDGAQGELVSIDGSGEVADFLNRDTAGKIVLVDRGLIEFRTKAANAIDAGAAALIITNRFAHEPLGGTLGDFRASIPILQVDAATGASLREFAGGDVDIQPAPPPNGRSQNVIARRPGGACRVVVGGHYDTVPGVDGANDNASGTALTLALAETWADHATARDLCFIGFGAEELGLHGSLALVRDWRLNGQLEDVTAMLNLDAIGDGHAPYQIIVSEPLRALSASVATELGIDASPGVLPSMIGSDHISFVDAGVPAVSVFPPGGIIHTPADTLDNVDRELYAEIAQFHHGVLGCLLQRAGSPITPRLSCGD